GGGTEEGGGADGGGTCNGGRVDLAQEAEAEALDEAPFLLLLRGLAVVCRRTLALRAERVVQGDGRSVADVGGPEALRQNAARAQQRPEGLALLLLARDLALVDLLLGNPAIVDRHRHEIEVATDALLEGADDGRQHPELRLHHLAGAGAAALDEELLRVPFPDQEREILPEHHLVELVVLERAPDEVRAGAAEQRTHRPEAQVDARRDVR